MARKQLKEIECPNCGGDLDIDYDSWGAVCQNCGAEFVMSDALKKRVLKTDAYKEFEEQQKMKAQGAEAQGAEAQGAEAQGAKSQSVQTQTKKSQSNKRAAGRKTSSSANGKTARKAAIIFGIIFGAIFVLGMIGIIVNHTINKEKTVELDWNSMILGEMLPQPEQPEGIVRINSNDQLCVDIIPATETDMKTYMDRCREMGYTIDEYKENGTSTLVFNEEGYRLELLYFSVDETMQIDLDAPIAMDEIEWPETGIASRIPKPESTYGKIVYEADDYFTAYIGNTTKQEYNKYVKACKSRGFTQDYSKYDRYFFAKNKNEDDMTLNYYGNNIMYIRVSNWNSED